MDYTHKLLATICTRIKFEYKSPSINWVKSRIKLIDRGAKTKSNDISTFRMISVTRIFSKLFHSIISDEMTTYMINNGYINTAIQKVFIRDSSGCIEHCYSLLEIIKQSKSKHRTLYATNFDLTDAYGKIPHNLIRFMLEHYHFPQNVAEYISNLYDKICGSVETELWTTEIFAINTGLFQGDTLSQIIFPSTFNILLEYLEHKYKNNKWVGYSIDNNSTSSDINNQFLKCLADDLSIVTLHKCIHQKCIADINTCIDDMCV